MMSPAGWGSTCVPCAPGGPPPDWWVGRPQRRSTVFHAAPIDGLPTLEEADGAGGPWPEPDGLMPPTADPPVPMRTFDDLRIAHQRLIGGALR